MIVHYDFQNESVYCLFNQNRSIIGANRLLPKSNCIIFEGLPANQDVTIIGFKMVGSDFSTAFIKTKVSEKIVQLEYKKTDESKWISELKLKLE